MLFKPKFFLDLGGGDQQLPAIVAPVREVAKAPAKSSSGSGPIQLSVAATETALSPTAAESPAALTAVETPSSPTAAAESPASPIATAALSVTTAEAILAELAAAQANRPEPSLVTFAPDRVTAGGATPINRRSAGANLAGFKEMAKGMMRS